VLGAASNAVCSPASSYAASCLPEHALYSRSNCMLQHNLHTAVCLPADMTVAAAAVGVAAGDTKRLQALEMQMHGSCSAPSGFAFMSLPGGCWRGCAGLRLVSQPDSIDGIQSGLACLHDHGCIVCRTAALVPLCNCSCMHVGRYMMLGLSFELVLCQFCTHKDRCCSASNDMC
jgi:hypothetical protein